LFHDNSECELLTGTSLRNISAPPKPNEKQIIQASLVAMLYLSCKIFQAKLHFFAKRKKVAWKDTGFRNFLVSY
jgi:hypothetical protein